MRRIRVIPILLIQDEGLVKSVQFKNHRYVGDPINAVKIFNEKEVDEIAILDISASKEGRGPNFDMIQEITNEAFMPLAYGGGITTVDEIKKLINSGIEKVIINSSVFANKELIQKGSQLFGSQSIVGCIDVKKNWMGKYQCFVRNGQEKIGYSPEEAAKYLEDNGCGEIIVQAIHEDGMCTGYDIKLIESVAKHVNVPIVALGGAWKITDLRAAYDAGASALAAGSMFVFHGKHKAVLITYPSQEELINQVYL